VAAALWLCRILKTHATTRELCGTACMGFCRREKKGQEGCPFASLGPLPHNDKNRNLTKSTLHFLSVFMGWVGYLGSGREGAQALLQLFQLLLELLQSHGWLLCASIPTGACQWLITHHLLHRTHCHVASFKTMAVIAVSHSLAVVPSVPNFCANKSFCACAFAVCFDWLHDA